MGIDINVIRKPVNSYFILSLFWATIFCQLTGLKFIWSYESISRTVNLLILATTIVLSIYVVLSYRYKLNVWLGYLIPGLLVFVGVFINITIEVISDFKLFSIYGLLIPWAVFLLMPFFVKNKKISVESLLKYYYYFMLISNILGMLDYLLMFNGLTGFSVKETPYGEFLIGNFSILHVLKDGTPHYRYYSCFMEPGTLAMFIFPALAYAFFHKKYIGIILLLTAFSLTASLGGVISLILFLLIVVFLRFKTNKLKMIFGSMLIVVLSITTWISFGDYLSQWYVEKEESATIREDNFSNAIIKLPYMMFKYPLGYPLSTTTDGFEKNKDYVGSNFTPANALQLGGILAFVGYTVCLLVALIMAIKYLLYKKMTIEEKIVFTSIVVVFPFIFQRAVIMDSAMYSFLVAPIIIMKLQKQNL